MKAKLDIEVVLKSHEDIYDLLNKAIRGCLPIAAELRIPTKVCGQAIMQAAVTNIYSLMAKPTKTDMVDMATRAFILVDKEVKKNVKPK